MRLDVIRDRRGGSFCRLALRRIRGSLPRLPGGKRIASRKNVTRAELLPHEISYRGCLITAVSGRRGRPCVRTQTPLSLTA